MERFGIGSRGALERNHGGADRGGDHGHNDHAVWPLAQQDHAQRGNKDWREAELDCGGNANAGICDRLNVGVLEEGLNEAEAEAKGKHATRKAEGAATKQDARRDSGGWGGDAEAYNNQHEGAERA